MRIFSPDSKHAAHHHEVTLVQLSLSSSADQRLRLHLLPLAVAAILIATAVPVEVQPALWWDGGFDASDFLSNLLLYAPLGVALHRRQLWAVGVAAAALSIVAEVLQMWSFDRFSSPFDVIANTLGAMLGASAWARIAKGRDTGVHLAVNGLLLTCALTCALIVLVIWQLPVRSAAISGWDRGFSLLLGNESTNDRPWRGAISSLAIVRGALSPVEVRAIGNRSIDPHALREHEALYESSQALVLDGGSAERLPQALAGRIVDAITADGAFSIIARIRPADLAQQGPARIISFSGGTLQRNFDLGQEEDRIVFRVRTPVSGVNGEDFRAETRALLQGDNETLIVASYDGGISRIFVNGSPVARSNLAANGCVVSQMCDSAVPVAWSLLGAIAAVIVLACVPRRSPASIMILAFLTGAIAICSMQLLHLVPAPVQRQAWMQCMALVGAGTVAVAAIASWTWRSQEQPRTTAAARMSVGQDH